MNEKDEFFPVSSWYAEEIVMPLVELVTAKKEPGLAGSGIVRIPSMPVAR